MKLTLTEGPLSISFEFPSSQNYPVTAEDVLLGAYDVISRAFSQAQVIEAYKNTNPEEVFPGIS